MLAHWYEILMFMVSTPAFNEALYCFLHIKIIKRLKRITSHTKWHGQDSVHVSIKSNVTGIKNTLLNTSVVEKERVVREIISRVSKKNTLLLQSQQSKDIDRSC